MGPQAQVPKFETVLLEDVLLEGETSEVLEEEPCGKAEILAALELAVTPASPEILLHALTGSHKPRTMRVK